MRHATLRFGFAPALLVGVVGVVGGCSSASRDSGPKVPPLGSKAPDFTLPDAHKGNVTLSELMKKGPVLIVFHLGYSCPRCVSHLRELALRKAEFDEYGTQIVAIGPDSVDDTQQSIEAYGDFPFPMLCDPELKVYHAYGLQAGPDTIYHGVFIVDPHDVVRMGAKSTHPIEDYASMLKCVEKVDSEN